MAYVSFWNERCWIEANTTGQIDGFGGDFGGGVSPVFKCYPNVVWVTLPVRIGNELKIAIRDKRGGVFVKLLFIKGF